MKTQWDYTDLAEAYLKRPDYSPAALEAIFSIVDAAEGTRACDIGAGVAHLTLPMAKRGFNVVAIEPNDSMRALGTKRTAKFSNVQWFEATGEETNQDDESFELVTFGSSFNVTDRNKALAETARILLPGGWFTCMWNHRDLEDPLQKGIEDIIKSHVASYDYGSRRQDQTEVIKQCGLFADVQTLEGEVFHSQTKDDCVEAWRSHATLQRQAGDIFSQVIKEIEALVMDQSGTNIKIPYTTRAWVARKA